MILYHGSTIEIKEIDLAFSKPNKDFGKGFYLSDNFDQAYEMARFKTELLGGVPLVTEFEFDEIAKVCYCKLLIKLRFVLEKIGK